MTRSYQANAKAVMMLQKPLERADQLSSQLNMSAASGWARQAGAGENKYWTERGKTKASKQTRMKIKMDQNAMIFLIRIEAM